MSSSSWVSLPGRTSAGEAAGLAVASNLDKLKGSLATLETPFDLSPPAMGPDPSGLRSACASLANSFVSLEGVIVSLFPRALMLGAPT